LFASFLSQGNQTPPSTAENNDCSDSGNYYFSRSAVAVLRQSNSHHRHGNGTQYRFFGTEYREVDMSVKRRGKNISQPLAYLDLGQSDRINYELGIMNYEFLEIL